MYNEESWKLTIEKLKGNPWKLPKNFIELPKSATCFNHNVASISDLVQQYEIPGIIFKSNFNPNNIISDLNNPKLRRLP